MKIHTLNDSFKLYIDRNTTSLKLLSNILKEKEVKDYKIVTNKYGYPYFENINDLYFNLSNKDEYTICGMSNNRIGVDIEKITFKTRVFDKYYTDKEKEYVLNSSNRDEAFTKIWVMKESYVKMLGIGLSYGLLNVDTFKLSNYFHISRVSNYYICVSIEPFI